METTKLDICLRTAHIRGENNQVADSLSRWFTDKAHQIKVQKLVPNCAWASIPHKVLEINWSI